MKTEHELFGECGKFFKGRSFGEGKTCSLQEFTEKTEYDGFCLYELAVNRAKLDINSIPVAETTICPAHM